jgi:hypothetical protein
VKDFIKVREPVVIGVPKIRIATYCRFCCIIETIAIGVNLPGITSSIEFSEPIQRITVGIVANRDVRSV